MSARSAALRLIYPHQLFADHVKAAPGTIMVFIEDDLFFKQFKFHKQKLILHRASMQAFADELRAKKFGVECISSGDGASMDALAELLAKYQPSTFGYYELVDDWLQQRLDKVLAKQQCKVERLQSPGFLTSRGQIEDYFGHQPNRMQKFYEWQRRRLNIMMDGDKPSGGKWSFDGDNRQKLPKNITLPKPYKTQSTQYVTDAQQWVEAEFAHNPGKSDPFSYPVTHVQAADWLQQFISQRLDTFGPYEDAMSSQAAEVFHSLLSPLLNTGLLTPQQVVDKELDYADNHDVPIASLEGFIRQVIGWREYMRATYVKYGRKMRTENYLEFSAKLHKGWWDATTGLDPIDTVLGRVLQSGYAHHIERLMLFGNAMVLLRIDPDEAYNWFMEMFIDAYDWVMVPNVYAMSQFATGAFITTKPYISGSNYIIKMSDYTKGEWSDAWDALYWQFIADKRKIIEQNYRSRMVVTLYDRFDDAKKQRIRTLAAQWLKH